MAETPEERQAREEREREEEQDRRERAARLAAVNEKYDDPRPWWAQER